MEFLFDSGLSAGGLVLLVVALLVALAFEFVNGFHDTANAVATVIYTHALRPTVAVVISGVCNFLGVFMGGIGVAMGIIHLLPVELLVSSGSGGALAMVLALLLSAIMWNLGTWWLGLPASSSHTLIGAIIGVGLANSALPGHTFGDGVNWHKAQEIGIALLFSPVFGFGLAGGLVWLMVRYMKGSDLLKEPPKDKPPPTPVRALLVATCSAVSFAHGSNDGQKGVGLVMLILMGLVPAHFAVDLNSAAKDMAATREAIVVLEAAVADAPKASEHAESARAALTKLRVDLGEVATARAVPRDARFQLRRDILLADEAVKHWAEDVSASWSPAQRTQVSGARQALVRLVEYAPTWVFVAIALALGVGTMVGWKRIVITVGEKIGKSHLTYGQGAAAELVAASTIGFSAFAGLPVSTTHVLSSGVAGTMVAQGSGVQGGTVRNIALAWVLTLPVSMLLSALLFLGFRLMLG